jgi:hypothetical protein
MLSGNHAMEDSRETSRTQPIMVYRDTHTPEAPNMDCVVRPGVNRRSIPAILLQDVSLSKIYALSN